MHTPEGAGGTSGGVGRYLAGLIMMCVGGYIFLSKVIVTTGALAAGFGFGTRLYAAGGFGITGGMIFIPFIIGIIMIFWNSKNPFGWLLSGLSIIALIVGIIVNIRMTLMPMSAFDIIVLIVLMAGGAGLFFSSLKNFSNS
ncbi:hypothetical protein FLL45_17775 [Aliikangiella marina]|uniref:Uncharacterized protein n=1 Tax=Aliikangiella marina TaxID=1712262 RepID=A0A545T4C2_9GAMM|nr:hypothetical protein [Aliikangiella marina]TQV72018.1 hypothetical protein FLL45_17495 [Aliikangiella marina]TQV72071.1 hypothetical protein FLL45_17775 [Aliikangiella marina]